MIAMKFTNQNSEIVSDFLLCVVVLLMHIGKAGSIEGIRAQEHDHHIAEVADIKWLLEVIGGDATELVCIECR